MLPQEERRISVLVQDVTGQKQLRLPDVPPDALVDEVVAKLLADHHFPRNDSEGRPLTYRARLDREGRHLGGEERIGDALQPGDNLTLQPNVDAG
jgi:hypothetical protein